MFLAALALSASLLTATPVATPEAVSASTLDNACTAQADCPAAFDQPTISCSGNTSCQVYTRLVICDGSFKQCTCSIAPANCVDPDNYCICVGQGTFAGICSFRHC